MNTEQLRAELIRDEGLKLSAYTDSLGYLTIGVGRLIDARRGGKIAHDEAMYLLDNDIAECVGDLRGSFPWFDKLTDARQRVLVNMRFQLGARGLRNFKNTLLAIERGDYQSAARNMRVSLWAKQTPNRAKRMADMMESGI